MDKKGRILILVNHDVVVYNFRLELVERLLAENYEVYISSPYGERIEELIKLGCFYLPVMIDRHGKNPARDGKLFRHYRDCMKNVRPIMVFTYTIKPNIYGSLAAASLHIPYVANITGLGSAVEKEGLLQYITVFLYKIAFYRVQKIFFQNKENMDFFINRGIQTKRHQLLPGSGVNLERFSLLPYPDNTKVEFIFISRIMKEKGIEEYLAAAEYISRKYPNTKFHICGFCEENYEKKLKKKEEEGVIRYYGMVKDIKELMMGIHCTVHPSYYPEGMSNVCLESAALGRPVITTDRSGCRETVTDGLTGFIIKQKDTMDLIHKIEAFLRLSNEKKKEMGLNGRRKMEQEFDRKIVVEQYLSELGHRSVLS